MKRTNLTNENIINIIKDYNLSMPIDKLLRKYKIRQSRLEKILMDHLVIKRQKIEYPQKYPFNYNYFSVINTNNKAYFLGLLYADGTLNEKFHSVNLGLQEDDKEILIKFSEEVNSKKPLCFINYEKFANRKNMFRMTLIKQKFYDDCLNLGLTPNKTFTAKFPENIGEEYYRDFIRGMWDGDGSIEITHNGYSVRITLTGTYELILKIKNIISEQLGDKKHTIKQRHPKRKNNNYTLSYCGIINSFQILTWLYQSSDISLSRKFNKVIEIKNIILNRYLAKQGKRFLLKNNVSHEEFLKYC